MPILSPSMPPPVCICVNVVAYDDLDVGRQGVITIR